MDDLVAQAASKLLGELGTDCVVDEDFSFDDESPLDSLDLENCSSIGGGFDSDMTIDISENHSHNSGEGGLGVNSVGGGSGSSKNIHHPGEPHMEVLREESSSGAFRIQLNKLCHRI